MAHTTYRRRNYYISADLQRPIILHFLIAALAGSATLIFLFAHLATHKIDTLLYSSMRLPKISPLSLLWPELLLTNICILGIITILFAWSAKRLYSRFDGPVTRLYRDLCAFNQSHSSYSITLRADDPLQEFARQLNDTSTFLANETVYLRELNSALDVLVRKQQTQPVAVAEIQKAVTALHDHLAAYTLQR